MSRKIVRLGVFETNSSSTHSICIAVGGFAAPKSPVHFKLGEFSWCPQRYDTVEDRASYLYTALIDNYNHSGQRHKLDDYLRKIERYLKWDFGDNIGCTFEGIDKQPHEDFRPREIYVDVSKAKRCYGIDHCDSLRPFIDLVLSDCWRFRRYLFSDRSFILTGNDNDDESDVAIDVNYCHEAYYKGN